MTSVEGLWTAEDQMTCEYEVRGLLGALVDLLKPGVTVETGTYLGHTTVGLSRHGVVHSAELNPSYAQQAADYCQPFSNIRIHHCTGEELIARTPHIDFAFVDSGGDRLAEVKALEDKGCKFIALHDSNYEGWKPILDYALEKGWRHIKFNTHRGMSLFQLP